MRVYWNCQGTEEFLLNCQTFAFDARFCNEPSEMGAGVYCFGKQTVHC